VVRPWILVPTKGSVHVYWMLAYENLEKPPGTMYAMEWRYGVPETRERLVFQALQDKECTHIFFLDDDVIPPANALTELLKHDLPIVSGIYFNSLKSGVSAWVGDKTIALEQPTRLVGVDKAALGCCLIKREVFEKLERPWFMFRIEENLVESEDFYFFDRVKKAQIPLYVDMVVKCGHIRVWQIDAEGKLA